VTWSRFRAAEVKASYAFVLSVISWIPCAAATMLAYRNYDPTLGQIIYGSTGRFVPFFVGCVLLSMGAAATAFALGWSSVLHPRNERPRQAWIGFFLGGGVLTLNLILMVTFYMIRLERPM